MHWKAEQERRKVDEDRAHLEFDEIIKKRKEDAAAAGLNGDDQVCSYLIFAVTFLLT